MSVFNFICRKVIKSTIAVTLVIQLMNLSIDPLDSSPQEDLTINEIESVYELVVEHVLDQENMIDETDENDSGSEKPVSSLILFSFFDRIKLFELPNRVDDDPCSQYSFDFESIGKTIQTPPPKFS